MKLLVFGKSGQVAQELARRCPEGTTATFLGRDEADLCSPDACAAAVIASEADVVINVAAYTAVDRAESEPALANVVNAEAPYAIARACAKRGIPLIHMSTDYVFSGTGTRPFAPHDATGALNAYGRSKLAGERAVQDSGARYVILRTSWVFSAHGANFVKTMLRLGKERDVLRVVDDQVGGPTPAAAIADALLGVARALTRGHQGGTYHFAGAPDVSWATFAREIVRVAASPCHIESIATAEYPTPATRPLNSRLDCTSFEQAFGIARPDWRHGLNDILNELGAVA